MVAQVGQHLWLLLSNVGYVQVPSMASQNPAKDEQLLPGLKDTLITALLAVALFIFKLRILRAAVG